VVLGLIWYGFGLGFVFFFLGYGVLLCRGNYGDLSGVSLLF